MISEKMKTLRYLSYKCDNETDFMKAVLKELLCALTYSIIWYVYHHILLLENLYWMFCNSAYIHLAYLKYWNGGIRRDIAINNLKDQSITAIFQCLAYNLYPYLVYYPFWWFWWLLLHTIYFYFMEDLNM